MRQVESRDAAVPVRGLRDAREIEGLAGAKLHPGPQHQRDLLALARQARLDVLLGQQLLALREAPAR